MSQWCAHGIECLNVKTFYPFSPSLLGQMPPLYRLHNLSNFISIPHHLCLSPLNIFHTLLLFLFIDDSHFSLADINGAFEFKLLLKEARELFFSSFLYNTDLLRLTQPPTNSQWKLPFSSGFTFSIVEVVRIRISFPPFCLSRMK